MPDGRALRGAGEAPIGNERDARPQLGIARDSLGRVEHLGHAGALGSLITDDHRIARLDLVREHRVNGVLLAIERTRAQRGLEHLARDHGVLDHGALGSEVAVQDGDGAVRAEGVVEGTDHVLALKAPLGEIRLALLVVAARAQLVEVLAQGLARHGHHVEMQHRADLLHDARHAAGIVEELRGPLAGRANVQQVVGAAVQAVEVVGRNLDAELARDRGDVEQRVGGARDGAVDHDQVLEGLAGDDVARAEIVLREPERLTTGRSSGFSQVGASCGKKRRAGKRKAEGLGRDLHGRGRAHEGARAARGARVVLGEHKLLVADLAALVTGADGAELLQGKKVGARVHNAADDHDGRDVNAPEGHEVRGQPLIAAGHEDAGVERRGLSVDLDHVGDGIAARQRVVDAVVTLCLAVADIGAEVARAVAARLGDARADLLDELEETGAAGVRVAGRGLDDDLRLVEVLNAPAGAEAQGVHLGADLAELARARLQAARELGGVLLDLGCGGVLHGSSPIEYGCLPAVGSNLWLRERGLSGPSAYANSEIRSAHARPERPMIVSMTVQERSVVFSSISRNDEHIQKPASFT